MLHDHFIDLPPILGKKKKKKENKYKVEKHHIYNTMTPNTPSLFIKKKKKKTHTKQYYLKIVQLNQKKKSN